MLLMLLITKREKWKYCNVGCLIHVFFFNLFSLLWECVINITMTQLRISYLNKTFLDFKIRKCLLSDRLWKKNKGEVSVGNIVEKSYRYKIFLINHIHILYFNIIKKCVSTVSDIWTLCTNKMPVVKFIQ